MDEHERRTGMDEVAKAIGALQAGMDAIARRQDSLQVERQSQHSEAIRSLTDVQAQIHEVKHAQNNDAIKFIQLERQIVAHQEQDTRDHGELVRRLDSHSDFARSSIEEIKKEIVTNRHAASIREEALVTRIDELFNWRNKMYGAAIVIALMMSVFGQHVGELIIGLFTGGHK